LTLGKSTSLGEKSLHELEGSLQCLQIRLDTEQVALGGSNVPQPQRCAVNEEEEEEEDRSRHTSSSSSTAMSSASATLRSSAK